MSTAELQETVFFILATVIVVCSILTVTTNRILRSATYLLFVLFPLPGFISNWNTLSLGLCN